jgi:hypothetical protein
MMINKKLKTASLSALVLASSIAGSASAAEYSVTVTNLTRGIYFTPLLLAAHSESARLFTSGEVASPSLTAMAEGGDIAGLVTNLQSIGANLVENPAAGLLGPGASTNATLSTDDSNTQLSVVSMLLPTNDGFVGLNSADLPTTVGNRVTFNVDAYDAGTEANDELRGSGMPGAPGFPAPGPVDTASGTNGTGINASVEGYVHIHRNVIGDFSATDGVSDIDATVHRWLNPVARVTVELISE